MNEHEIDIFDDPATDEQPAHVQSDVELARTIHEECYIDKSQSERSQLVWDASIAAKLIEADRAAHRQAGREEAEESLSSLIELAEEVKQWSEAYPTDIFSEPTPEQIDEVCKVLGFRIDNISAMVLRAFTKPWGDKARRALSDLNEARKG